MRGGPCAAGPSVKLGPWRCNQSNWSYCATSSRLNKTAAEGKSAQPFWSCPAGGRGRGDEQWGRLGDARRAAVLLCPKGGDVKAPPTACIARGPDGTKGFVLRRARRAGGGVQHREAKALEHRSDIIDGLATILFRQLKSPFLLCNVALHSCTVGALLHAVAILAATVG